MMELILIGIISTKSLSPVDIALERLKAFGLSDSDTAIVIVVSEQRLYLVRGDGDVIRSYPVSTSKFGIGNRFGSYKTPVGAHRIWCKVGDGALYGEIIRHRKPTGRIAHIRTDTLESGHDYITTREMCLEGLEEGVNKGDSVDSKIRAIYIHGTADEGRVGRMASYGCIRMKNRDVIELYDLVHVGTLVYIIDDRKLEGADD